MIVVPKLCDDCKNKITGIDYTCLAYPKGIPEKILYSVTHYHDQPAPGDKGIRFTPDDNRTIAEWKKEVPPFTQQEYDLLPPD